MSIILFIVILVVLILVHEFGHFIVAKRAGIRVDEFGIGFPPRAVRLWKSGETEYTLNWLPFGGFVKIFGEDPNDESIEGPDRARSFVHKPFWIQAAVLVAGVAFNVLLAWLLFIVTFSVGMTTVVTDENRGEIRDRRVVVASVLPGSPAEVAGIPAGAEIISLRADGEVHTPQSIDEITSFISARADTEILIVYRNPQSLDEAEVALVPVTGLVESEPSRAAVGVSMGEVGTLALPIHRAIVEAGVFTITLLGAITVALAEFFASAFTLSADLSQVAGPVGIVGLVGDTAALGLIPLLSFTAFISLNLAIINLIPFPALDGGRLLFAIIEALKGSPIKPIIANTLNTIGFALLILLMLAVTYSDIAKIVG